VTTTIASSNGIGINDHKSLNKEEVTIYIPGNIVVACSPESLTANTFVYGSSNGFISAGRTYAERVMGVVVSDFTTATTNKKGRVLLL